MPSVVPPDYLNASDLILAKYLREYFGLSWAEFVVDGKQHDYATTKRLLLLVIKELLAKNIDYNDFSYLAGQLTYWVINSNEDESVDQELVDIIAFAADLDYYYDEQGKDLRTKRSFEYFYKRIVEYYKANSSRTD